MVVAFHMWMAAGRDRSITCARFERSNRQLAPNIALHCRFNSKWQPSHASAILIRMVLTGKPCESPWIQAVADSVRSWLQFVGCSLLVAKNKTVDCFRVALVSCLLFLPIAARVS